MGLDVHCPRKAIKLNHSLTHSHFPLHRKLRVIIMPTLSLQVLPEDVLVTTVCAACDNKVDIMVTLFAVRNECTWLIELLIYGHYSSKYSQLTAHSSNFRQDMGVSFVSWQSDLCVSFSVVKLGVVSNYIRSCINFMRWHIQQLQLPEC